jgi:hypothetical protein
MMHMEKFRHISMRGRVAYGISCFENAIIALKYNVNLEDRFKLFMGIH